MLAGLYLGADEAIFVDDDRKIEHDVHRAEEIALTRVNPVDDAGGSRVAVKRLRLRGF